VTHREHESAESDDRAGWIRAVLGEFETPLLRHATRILNGDADRARDIVQDTFIKLWKADRKEVEPHLAQWLFTVSRNRALDVLRKDGRMISLNGELTRKPAPPQDAPDHASGGSEGKREAIAMLEELPGKQKEAIRLKLQAQLSYKEIAEVMDVTVNHVGVLIHSGLKTIRETLTASASSEPSSARIAPEVGQA